MNPYSLQIFTLFARCAAAGITLTQTVDGNLSVTPAAKLTEPLRTELRANKAAILALVHPRITEQNTLIIPTFAPLKYQWWREGGQPVADTVRELGGNVAAYQWPDRKHLQEDNATLRARWQKLQDGTFVRTEKTPTRTGKRK